MLQIALLEPEIPPNTGNIIRLCANTGSLLHLIKPLGFELDDKRMRRAGLDYREWADVQTHDDYKSFIVTVAPKRIFACSTKGKTHYADNSYQEGDLFLFGPETRGLPKDILTQFFVADATSVIRIPMLANSRSLNLSNACAVILYEAWRQLGFKGMD